LLNILFSPKGTTGNAITPILSLAFDLHIISLTLSVIIELTFSAATPNLGHYLIPLSF